MGWKANNLTTQTGSPLATFHPAAYLFAQNTRDVVYQRVSASQGSDGHQIIELAWTPGGATANATLTEAESPDRPDVRRSR